jgi:drug/metabolite transporter (DMT)-like permease
VSVTAATPAAAASRPSALRLAFLFTVMVTVWSLSFVIIKNVAREIPPVPLTAMRAMGSALVMIPVALWDVRRNPRSRWKWADAPRLFLVASCGITFNHLFFVMGVSRTSVAHSSIVMALMPAIVLVLAIFWGLERATLIRFVGMGIAILGVAVLQTARGGESVATPLGDLLVFGGALAFSFFTVLSKSLTLRYGSIYVNALCFVAGAVSLAPIAWVFGDRIDLSRVSALAWISMAYLIVIHTVICYLIFYYLLTHVSASRVSLFGYIQPVLASLFAWLLLSEPVTASIVAGGALVMTGVWLAERRR